MRAPVRLGPRRRPARLAGAAQCGLWIAVSLGVAASVLAQPPNLRPDALRRSHSHNDYYRQRPLQEALECGFGSVEADLFLQAGRLLVGHNRQELNPQRSLRALYLEPLRERIAQLGGKVYPDGTRLLLLIDIKSDATATFAALGAELHDYHSMLTRVDDSQTIPGPVTVVVSGNRDILNIAAATPKLAFVDGRLGDLKREPDDYMPLISDSWSAHFRWRGQGSLPAGERRQLRSWVRACHARGQAIRFWATPDHPAMWRELWDAGVDFIGTDDPTALQQFINQQVPLRGR